MSLNRGASRGRPLKEEKVPFANENQSQDDAYIEMIQEEERQKTRSCRRCSVIRLRLLVLRYRRRRFFTALVIASVLLAALLVALYFVSKLGMDDDKNRYIYKTAAVATDSTQCSQIGKQILEQGGNGVDATIASLLCLGLTDPQSMGVGGGFFMTIYNRTSGHSTFIDSREVAPLKATEDMFVQDPTLATTGPLAIAVPGEIKGYWYAHQRYGSLPWSDIFQPAIDMAANGFPIPNSMAKAITQDTHALLTQPSLREVFFNKETGNLYKEGEIIKRPQLAETLRVVSKEGADALYNGSLTHNLVKDLEDIGSLITKEDFLHYKVLEKEPIDISFDSGLRFISSAPPGSGCILAFILNILDGYHFKPSSIKDDKSATLTYHRIIESFKFAFAKRTGLADPRFVDVHELVKNLTSNDYADYIRGRITDNKTHGYDYYGPTYYDRITTSTSHMSVIDQHGNGVGTTSTINARFGSQRRGMRTGIIFNDEMDDFSSPNVTNKWGIVPSPANFIKPGKRPLSSMNPTVFVGAKDGEVKGVLGTAGGSMITPATAWVAAHALWLGDNIKEAIVRPRLHHQLLPPYVMYEANWKDKNILRGLMRKGHELMPMDVGRSIVQGISRLKNGKIEAYSDFRKGGTPDGF